jgi:hypothetical protein
MSTSAEIRLARKVLRHELEAIIGVCADGRRVLQDYWIAGVPFSALGLDASSTAEVILAPAHHYGSVAAQG